MKKTLIFAITLLLTFITAFSFTACQVTDTQSDLEYIQQKGKLVVGVTVYKPMDWQDENGEWVGFDAELAKLFAEEIGVECQFVVIDWNNKVAEINTKQIDLIWNGMTAGEKIAGSIDFSVSYAENRQVAVVQSQNLELYNSVDKIKNASIAVENGSAGAIVTQSILNAAPTKVTAQVDALNEVLAGTSNVAIIDYTMAASLVGKNQYESLCIVDVNTVSFEREVFAVGLRKNSDVKATLDAFLKAKYADNTLQQLAEKYQSVVLNTAALEG